MTKLLDLFECTVVVCSQLVLFPRQLQTVRLPQDYLHIRLHYYIITLDYRFHYQITFISRLYLMFPLRILSVHGNTCPGTPSISFTSNSTETHKVSLEQNCDVTLVNLQYK